MAAFTFPGDVFAQTERKPLIALLAAGGKGSGVAWYGGILEGMRAHGYVEGRDFVYEERYADSDLARLPALANELIALRPDVLIAGTSPATVAAAQATSTIPIVGINLSEPVKIGLALTEARPGKNVTGTLISVPGLIGKRLGLAKEVFPHARRIGVLLNPDNPITTSVAAELAAVSRTGTLELSWQTATVEAHYKTAFREFARQECAVVIVQSDTLFGNSRRQLAAFALVNRLPTLFAYRDHVEDGGLLSYGVSLRANYRRAGYFVDRILKGAKAADLPIEFPTQLELVINMATARALEVEIPPSVLATADEVIE
ncbi:MAG: ABC transporter substrate-binding protein [Xanthobacteraceae bacterium]